MEKNGHECFMASAAIDKCCVSFDDGNVHKMELFEYSDRTLLRFNDSVSMCYISLSQKELDSVINFLKMYNGGRNGD